MHFIRRLLLVTSVPLLIAGCGGSSRATNSQSTTTIAHPETAPLPGTTSTTSSTAARATHTSAAGETGASGSAAGVPPTGGVGLPAGASQRSTRTSPAGGSVGARIPANFTLSGSRTLDPQTVSAPAFVAIAVSVRSNASRIETVTLDVPPSPVALRVPPHGRAQTTIHGLRAGDFPILIDGSRRGALLIGAAPGP